METHKKFKIEKNAVRIFVFLTGVLMTIYCGLLLFGIRHMAAEIACVTAGYAVLFGAAWMYRFCWIGWSFIAYIYAVRICIILYPEGYFEGECALGNIEILAHATAFLVGLALTACLAYKVFIDKYFEHESE